MLLEILTIIAVINLIAVVRKLTPSTLDRHADKMTPGTQATAEALARGSRYARF